MISRGRKRLGTVVKVEVIYDMKVEIRGNIAGRLCVYNCLDTPRGLEIAAEMLSWLEPLYRVHVVHHDGSRFEYWGIKYLKELVERTGQPCLYLHTKGACNKPARSMLVRRMWRCEFGDEDRAKMYFDVVDCERSVIACPIGEPRKIPSYNGFVVNKAACEAFEVGFNGDRLLYEQMWRDKPDSDLRAMKYWGRIKDVHRFLDMQYGDERG